MHVLFSAFIFGNCSLWWQTPLERHTSKVTSSSIPLMSCVANLRSNTNHMERAVGRARQAKTERQETRPVSAVCLETREGQGDVDLSVLRKNPCVTLKTFSLHPTEATWGPGCSSNPSSLLHNLTHFVHTNKRRSSPEQDF